ncbi:hypothetical protein AABB24_032647 [Solanum stoloniferum]|uniref:Uncharacterized protein n=1 Tax=Solanum stoloniferum TaxID=62892 RepID=A0ABD2RK81_9SOLN
MAHSAISQMSVAVPLQTDSSFRRSTFKATSLTFSDKSCISMPSIDLKAARSRSQYVVCMSVQQASKAKVSVSPLSLEGAKEPPLNIYKPKEPYTATIVSVERIVGPKAPGETCHIVIDHDGNLLYREGQR